jgi:hypothetical protein
MGLILEPAENFEEVEKPDMIAEVLNLVELFTISQKIVGEQVELKHTNPYDDTHQIKVVKNDYYDFLKVRYSPTMVTVEFKAFKGVDDKLINRLTELAKEDEAGDDRFVIESNGDEYLISAIFIGYEPFEEMFPKMYSHV